MVKLVSLEFELIYQRTEPACVLSLTKLIVLIVRRHKDGQIPTDYKYTEVLSEPYHLLFSIHE